MNSYTLNHEFHRESIAQKQEKWRQRQLNIFYKTGRPIFDISVDTEHLRPHNNPHYHRDPAMYQVHQRPIVNKNK